MCFDYDGTCDVWHEKIRIAKQSHRCCSCCRTIQPGEQYVAIRWIYEHEAGKYKICNQCEQDRRLIREHEYDDGCEGIEAECPPQEIRQYMRDADLPRAILFVDLKEKELV